MKDIYIFKDGQTRPAKIERLFDTHGPYTIEDRRLDKLIKVQVMVDSSTSTISQTGTTMERAQTGSMLGRALVGGVLAGGTGAVVGGLSGKRESNINAVSSESLNTDLTAEIIFDDSSSMYVQIKSIESFHWLLSFAGQPPLTDEELEDEKVKAQEAATERAKALEEKAKQQLDENNGLIEPIVWFVVLILVPLTFTVINSTIIENNTAYPTYQTNNATSSVTEPTQVAAPTLNAVNDLNKYATGLAASTENKIFDPVVTISNKPNRYIIKFRTVDPHLKLKDVDKDPDAYHSNNAMNVAWEKRFCTPELKSIIRTYSISRVRGEILDNELKDGQFSAFQAIAECNDSSATTIELMDKDTQDNLDSIKHSLEGMEALRR